VVVSPHRALGSRVIGVAAVVILVGGALAWPSLQRYVGTAPPRQVDEPLSVALPAGTSSRVLGLAHNAGNNLGTLAAAVRSGADVVEIDVMSAHGGLAAGREQQPFPGLARRLFRGPSLEQAWEAAAGTTVKLDLRQSERPFLDQVAAFVAAHAQPRPMISSSDRSALLYLHQRVPGATLLASVSNPAAVQRARADEELVAAVRGLSAFHGLVTPDLMAWAHARHLLVLAWTVDDGATVDRLVHLGVDGVTTPNLAVLRALGPHGSDG